ncbi:MAG: exonuclease [Bacillota bacterium]|nr:exonuclease [Bacillota bacterium]
MVRLTFYDGAACIGGNKILCEADGTALLLDFGTNFGAEGTFFDEFLRPRAIVGLSDLLDLGLLPPLRGIYRQDFELPGRARWAHLTGHPCYRCLEVSGVLLSHAHIDHSGYISFLDHRIPVYTGLVTALIAKAMQDTVPGGFDRETCYITPREVRDGLLQATDYRRVACEQRRYVCLETPSLPPAAGAFWSRPASSRPLNCFPLEAAGKEVEIGNLRIRYWPVDHSIPGAGAFGIETSEGWVLYTGDLRLHGTGAGKTRRFMEEAAELAPLALICEGTHPGTERPVYEEEVADRAREVIRRAEGLVLADFGPRNIERLLSFRGAAKDAGRRLGITTKDAYLLEALATAGGEVPDPLADDAFALYVDLKAVRPLWERELLERYRSRCPERVVDAGAVSRDQGAYVLCFSYYDFHKLLDIMPGSGVYIYSSSEAFNEEMHIDLDRLRAWLRYFNLSFVGDPGDREGRGREPGFHASGHIHGPGLVELVEAVGPQVLIPVHSEDRRFFEQFRGLVRLVVPEHGETVVLP